MAKPYLPPEKFRAYIADLIDYCASVTFHNEYVIRTYWKKSPAPDEDGESDTCACITVDHIYLQMAVSFYPAMIDRWKAKKFETVGNIVLHELCHGYLKPIQHIWQWDDCESQKKAHQEIIERQTTRIANSLADLLPVNWFMPEVVARLRPLSRVRR